MKRVFSRKIAFTVLTLLTAVMMISAVFSLNNKKQVKALTTEGIEAAYKIGDKGDGSQLDEIFNIGDNSFDGSLMVELLSKITGIDGATIDDVSDLFETSGVELYQSKVVQSPIINKNAGNEEYGLVLRLYGYDWMVTSLTYDNTTDKNIILTLYLTEEVENMPFNTDTATPRNMYGTSTIRQKLISDGEDNKFKNFATGTFAQKYLIQPKYINYQKYQTTLDEGAYNVVNNALDITENLFSSSSYLTNDQYTAWGDDYIWLPSNRETNMYKSDGSTAFKSSIFEITYSQLNTANSFWLRSAQANLTEIYIQHQVSGKSIYTSTDTKNSNGLRPAIHLNLSAAAKGTGFVFQNPEDYSIVYNGKENNVKELVSSETWYRETYYEDADKFTVTYPTNVKDVGEYWTKVEINQSWIDSVKAENPSARVKFRGEPDMTDNEHMESDTVRWFKFTVTPKEITVTAPAYNASTGVFTPPKFADESELYADRPAVATKFTGTAADGTEINQIDEIPNRKGTYTAQAVLVNSTTDKTEYDGNYVIKDASTIKCTVSISRGRLSVPSVADASKAYIGEAVKFALTGYSESWTEYAGLTLPAGLTLEGSDEDGWNLVATDAGTYDVTRFIKPEHQVNWCWNTGDFTQEDVNAKTFSVTVTRKQLTVDFTTSSGAFLLQAGAEVTFGAEPANNYSRDEVKLTLEYFNSENSSVKIPVPSGRLDASGLNPGTYYLVATLNDDAAAGNKNYNLDGGEARQEFTVSAKNIVIDSVNWQYTQNNGVPTAVTGGAGLNQSAPVEVTYNGSAYVFALNSNGLADAGVKVDATFGTNGYINGSQTNATADVAAITVRLIPFEDGFAFNDENGKPLENQYKDFTLYVKVNKADVDFSGVVWSAEELQYNAVSQSVNIASGLPSFVTVTYNSGARGTNIGEYTAKVASVSLTSAAAANYNTPGSADIDASPYLTHKWNIVKRRIEVQWQETEQTQDGTIILVPSLNLTLPNVSLEYSYYNDDKSLKMTLDEIFADYDETTVKDYNVGVKLKESGGSYNASNSVLIEGSSEVTEAYRQFSAGESKTPVRVGLTVSKVTYNGSAQPAKFEYEGGNLSEADFVITYSKGGTACGVPTGAGVYKVHIAINAASGGDYAITGACDFDYEIEKASFDLSGAKWVDTENNNAEYTEAYTYGYNVSHTLALTGLEEVTGLSFGYTADTEDKRTAENAGSYIVIVEFEVSDPDNWYVPDNIEFTWVIKPYAPDLSAVTWNYNADGPFTFKITNGTAVKYSVRLQGLPEGLEDLIEYSGDTAEYSDAGSHITSFAIKENDIRRGNWGELVFGSGLEMRLVWEIKAKTIDKAAQRQTQIFRTEGYDFAEITNLPEDFAQYFDVKVLNRLDEEVPAEGGTWKFVNVNVYRIQLTFKAGMNKNNGGTADNVKWSDNAKGAYQIIFTLDKLSFDVDGWTDGVENGRAELDAVDTVEIEKYFDYVIVKTDTGDILAGNAVLEYDTDYTIALKVKAQYEGNVVVNYNGGSVGETAPYAFKTEADPLTNPPEHFYRKPSGSELTVRLEYTGEEQDFVLGSWFDPNVMQVISGDMHGTNFGKYPVRVGFKRGSLSAWEPADAPKPDTSAVTITFVITKKMVEVPAEGSVEYNGKTQVYLPQGFDAALMEVVGDNTGKEVGSYSFRLALKDPENTVWNDGSLEGTTANQTVSWRITVRVFAKPTLDKITYTGAEVDLAKALKGFISTEMTLSGDTKATNAGTYTVTVTLKNPASNIWATEEEIALYADSDEITFEWSIAKAQIKPSWNVDGDIPSLNTPSEFFGLVDFDYVFTDSTGKTVSKSKLKNGEEYRIIAKIRDEYADNFEFVTATGGTSPTPMQSSPYTFEAVVDDDGSGNNNGSVGTLAGGGSMPEYMWIILAVVICGMAFNGLLLIVLLFRREKGREITLNIPNLQLPQPPYPPYPYYPYPPAEKEDRAETAAADIYEGELVNEGEAKNMETPSFYAFEQEEGKTVKKVSETAAILDGEIVNSEEAANIENAAYFAFDKAGGENVIKITENAERPDINDAFASLSEEQQYYFCGLRDYAAEQSGAGIRESKYSITVGSGSGQIMNLEIKDGLTVALFRIEDPRLSKLRLSGDANIKTKKTVIPIDGEDAFNTAKEVVDLRIAHIKEAKEYKKLLRKNKRTENS